MRKPSLFTPPRSPLPPKPKPDVSPDGARADDPRVAARRPRILVSAHFVFAGRVGGAEHMLYNLLRGIGPHSSDLAVLCASERNLAPAALANLRRQPGARVVECGAGPGPRFLAEQRACLRGDLAGDAILFPNYFVPPVTPRRLGQVATVLHDFQYRHFPQYFTVRKRAWLRAVQTFAVHKADRVIIISDFVRRDAARLFGQGVERKLEVIPNPVSWERFGEAAAASRPLDLPYILSVAAQYPHKNLEVLVRAFAEVARRDRDLQLVLCGQDYHGLRGVAAGHGNGSLGALVEALGLSSRVHLTGYVDDAALGQWYRHAHLFAFPSLFEGFGMPAVEALGLGLPTITTKLTALPETTLGLAQYVENPTDVGEWAEWLTAVARDPGRFRPTEAGIARLHARYDLDAVGKRYVEVCCTT